jgi:hypothetical protein
VLSTSQRQKRIDRLSLVSAATGLVGVSPWHWSHLVLGDPLTHLRLMSDTTVQVRQAWKAELSLPTPRSSVLWLALALWNAFSRLG